jgi:hypothetical protein
MEYRDVQYILEEDDRGAWQWAVVMGRPPLKSGHAVSKRDCDPQGLDRSIALSIRTSSGWCNRTGPRPDFRERNPPSMSDTRIDFSAPAILRKWPSVNKERVSASLGARPYMIIDGTLDECIQKLMLQPELQRHLYEIHTAPQSDLVSKILSGEHVVELARLRDYLEK